MGDEHAGNDRHPVRAPICVQKQRRHADTQRRRIVAAEPTTSRCLGVASVSSGAVSADMATSRKRKADKEDDAAHDSRPARPPPAPQADKRSRRRASYGTTAERPARARGAAAPQGEPRPLPLYLQRNQHIADAALHAEPLVATLRNLLFSAGRLPSCSSSSSSSSSSPSATGRGDATMRGRARQAHQGAHKRHRGFHDAGAPHAPCTAQDVFYELEVRLGKVVSGPEGKRRFEAGTTRACWYAVLRDAEQHGRWERVEDWQEDHCVFYTLSCGRAVRTTVSFCSSGDAVQTACNAQPHGDGGAQAAGNAWCPRRRSRRAGERADLCATPTPTATLTHVAKRRIASRTFCCAHTAASVGSRRDAQADGAKDGPADLRGAEPVPPHDTTAAATAVATPFPSVPSSSSSSSSRSSSLLPSHANTQRTQRQDVRISLSSEQRIGNEQVPHMVKPERVAIRQRKRFIFGRGRWALDMTLVWAGRTKSHAEQAQRTVEPEYHVEFECTAPADYLLEHDDLYCASSLLLKIADYIEPNIHDDGDCGAAHKGGADNDDDDTAPDGGSASLRDDDDATTDAARRMRAAKPVGFRLEPLPALDVDGRQ